MVSPYVVSGYFTPNYAKWVRPLRGYLDKYGQPHDIMPVQPASSWENATLEKPGYILDAMDAHPGKTIIWLDVDCTVHGDLSPLAALPGDVALRFEIKARRGRALTMRAHSGTMVIHPTAAARRFIDAWFAISHCATRGEDDEATLARAITDTPGVALTQLELKWFSSMHNGRTATDRVIVHDWASRDTRKVHKITRFVHRHLGTLALQRG